MGSGWRECKSFIRGWPAALKVEVFIDSICDPILQYGISRKTCFWVNSHKRWLAQNYFQIFKFVFSCLLSGKQCILSNAWKNLFKWDCFQTINDGLSLLIPIHSCSKWKTNWPISKKCSEIKIRRCHLQNQPYLEKCLCYMQTWSWCHFKA